MSCNAVCLDVDCSADETLKMWLSVYLLCITIFYLLTIIKPIQMKATVTKDFLLHSLPCIRLQMWEN